MQGLALNEQGVKGIGNGTKTNSRRPVKHHLDIYRNRNEQAIRIEPQNDWYKDRNHCIRDEQGGWMDLTKEDFLKLVCKYQVGEVVYVQERFYVRGGAVFYKASYASSDDIHNHTNWKPPHEMQEHQARYFLKIKSIKVERLQDISEEDCFKEGLINFGYVMQFGRKIGVSEEYTDGYQHGLSYEDLCMDEEIEFEKFCFKWHIWNNLPYKAPYDWNSNPYVFVYELERVER